MCPRILLTRPEDIDFTWFAGHETVLDFRRGQCARGVVAGMRFRRFAGGSVDLAEQQHVCEENMRFCPAAGDSMKTN